MLRWTHSFKKFASDRRGATVILASLAMAALMGFTALGVDLGSLFFQKRRQQTANDLAALAAASDLTRANSAARATLTRNQTQSTANVVVETGIYTPDPNLTPSARFVPSTASTTNAARVVVQSQQPIYFGRVLSLLNQGTVTNNTSVNVKTSAIAATNAQASFAVGTRLLNLNGGILNGLLGGLLGTNLSLQVMDYQSLANAKLDMFTFADKLATRLNLTAANYSQVLTSNVYVIDALNAVLDAVRANPANNASAISALSAIVGAKQGSTDRVDLSSLLSVGVYGARMPGQGSPLNAAVSALQAVSLLAQLADGNNQVDLSLGLSLPGVSSVSLSVTIGERPVGRTAVTVGSVGAQAHTAQTRLLLTISLVGSGKAALIRVPIYIEVANAVARLTAVTCSPSNLSSSSVTLGVKPGVIDAWIGNVTNADMTNFTTAPNPGPATLVNAVGVVTVTGRAHATISNMTETPLTFSYADITAGTVKSTSTTSFITPLLTSLIGDLRVQASALGGLLNLDLLGLGGLLGTENLVVNTISGATSSIDSILASVLSALGISIGQADAWVTDVRCGNAVLVN